MEVAKLAHILAGQIEKYGAPFGTLARQIGNLARLGTLARQVEILARLWPLARLLACWHAKMRGWHTFGTLARRPRWHV